jgi:hypothetical protein
LISFFSISTAASAAGSFVALTEAATCVPTAIESQSLSLKSFIASGNKDDETKRHKAETKMIIDQEANGDKR